MALILGGVVFRNFEIPENVLFPIRQRHHIHYHVGAARVVDATGPDPQPIRWSGRFTGPDASDRARALESMAEGGLEWTLVFASFQRQVLVTDFQPDLRRSYDIPYAIECLPTNGINPGRARDEAVDIRILEDLARAASGAKLGQTIADVGPI